MPNIFFKDAVTGANLDSNAKFAVFYTDSRYANRTAVAKQCPHAKLFGITTRGMTGPGIFAVDSETGDLNVPETEAWVAEQIRLGVELICVYANLNRWLNEGLKDALAKYGSRIKRWVADFNNIAEIQPWADAEQYADPGPVDLNVARANFFGQATPVSRPVHEWSAEIQVSIPEGSTGVLHFAGTLELENGSWDAHGAPGNVHFTGPGGGQWRIKGIQLDAQPLGK